LLHYIACQGLSMRSGSFAGRTRRNFLGAAPIAFSARRTRGAVKKRGRERAITCHRGDIYLLFGVLHAAGNPASPTGYGGNFPCGFPACVFQPVL
jgi:hypothetical protein